jgi:hypothetical protein
MALACVVSLDAIMVGRQTLLYLQLWLEQRLDSQGMHEKTALPASL